MEALLWLFSHIKTAQLKCPHNVFNDKIEGVLCNVHNEIIEFSPPALALTSLMEFFLYFIICFTSFDDKSYSQFCNGDVSGNFISLFSSSLHAHKQHDQQHDNMKKAKYWHYLVIYRSGRVIEKVIP
jgi:hypothetical protein